MRAGGGSMAGCAKNRDSALPFGCRSQPDVVKWGERGGVLYKKHINEEAQVQGHQSNVMIHGVPPFWQTASGTYQDEPL